MDMTMGLMGNVGLLGVNFNFQLSIFNLFHVDSL